MNGLTVRGYTEELYTGNQHQWNAVAMISQFNGNRPKSLEIPPGVKVDLYSGANYTGQQLTLTTSVASLKGTHFETASPQSMSIWLTEGWIFDGQWAIKAGGKFLNSTDRGILQLSESAPELFEIQGYTPLSQDGAARQSVRFYGKPDPTVIHSVGAGPLTVADLNRGATILAPISEYEFALQLTNRSNQWVILNGSTLSLTPDITQRAIFKFAFKYAPREGNIGKLSQGEAALFEEPGYVGRAWVVWGDIKNPKEVPGFSTTIGSIQLGPQTAITGYDSAKTLGGADDFVSHVPNTEGTVFQNLYEVSVWRIADPETYNIRCVARLSAEYAPPLAGKQTLQSLPVVRAQISFQGSNSRKNALASLWTSTRTNVIANGAKHDNLYEYNPLPINAKGSSQIVIPVSSMKIPLLRLRTQEMRPNEYIVILPDVAVYEAISRMDTNELANARTASGQRLFPDAAKAPDLVNSLKLAAEFMKLNPYAPRRDDTPLPTTIVSHPEDALLGSESLDPLKHLLKGVSAEDLKKLNPFPGIKKIVDGITPLVKITVQRFQDLADGLVVRLTDANGGALLFVLDAWSQVTAFFNKVITAIVTNAKAFYEWIKDKVLGALGSVDWSQYLTMKDEIKAKIVDALTHAKLQMNQSRELARNGITSSMGQLLSKIDFVIRYLDKTENKVVKRDSRKSSSITFDKFDWLFNQITGIGGFLDSALPLSDPSSALKSTLTNILNMAQDQALALQTLEGPLTSLLTDTQKFDDSPETLIVDILKLIRALLNNVVTAVSNVVDLFLGAIEELLNYLLAMLNTKINIPGLSALYSFVVREDMTPLSLIALMIAVPAQSILNMAHATQSGKKYEAIGIAAAYTEGNLGLTLDALDLTENSAVPQPGQQNKLKLLLEGTRLAAGLVAWMMDAPGDTPLQWHNPPQNEEQCWENIVWWTDFGVWAVDLLATTSSGEGTRRAGYVGIGIDTFCGLTQLAFGITLLAMRQKQDASEIVETIVGALPSVFSVARVQTVVQSTGGASLAAAYGLSAAAVYTPYVWGIVKLTQPERIAPPPVYRGALLWYQNGLVNGIPQPQSWGDPVRIDQTGWQRYQYVFGGDNGVIYAVTPEGNLLWHRFLSPQNPGSSDFAPNSGKVIGSGGWDTFQRVFGGHNGFIYAITSQGQLRVYKYNSPNEYAGDNWLNPTGETIANEGWNTFTDVFGGHNGVIYTVTNSGNICWNRLLMPGQGNFAPQSGQPIGTGGWNGFKQVFGGVNGVIYAIEQAGNIRAYKYNTPLHYSNNGWANPIGSTIGTGGWNTFHKALGGYEGVIYTITM